MHLVGFILRKFVTMHGHVNVKLGMFFFSVLISCSGDQGSDLSQGPTAGFVAKEKLTG
jgi:hypothetical protein